MLQKEITRRELIEQHKIEEQKILQQKEANKKFSELYEKYFDKKVNSWIIFYQQQYWKNICI